MKIDSDRLSEFKRDYAFQCPGPEKLTDLLLLDGEIIRSIIRHTKSNILAEALCNEADEIKALFIDYLSGVAGEFVLEDMKKHGAVDYPDSKERLIKNAIEQVPHYFDGLWMELIDELPIHPLPKNSSVTPLLTLDVPCYQWIVDQISLKVLIFSFAAEDDWGDLYDSHFESLLSENTRVMVYEDPDSFEPKFEWQQDLARRIMVATSASCPAQN
jgi:hypothetical protein